MRSVSDDALEDWIGRTESVTDMVSARAARALAATLDERGDGLEDGAELPPGWHWLYCHESVPASALGRDGHARRGAFLPPVTLPRRMWAGGEIELRAPLRIGDRVTRHSRVAGVTRRSGRSGALVFVRVRHRWANGDGDAIVEIQDLVYRDVPGAMPAPDAQRAEAPADPCAPSAPCWTRELVPDPVLLFRYSALTFNAHRIHYDRDWCREREGYPGLVVHAPLTATLLLGLVRLRAPRARVRRFSFRALRPLFDGLPFSVNGRREGARADLWAADGEGRLAMRGEADLAAHGGPRA